MGAGSRVYDGQWHYGQAATPADRGGDRGVDLGQVDDEAFRRIYDAWLEHLLLIFPEQDVTDEEQIAFARRFGEFEIHPSPEHRSSHHPEIYRVSIVDEHGSIIPQESKSWRYMNLTCYGTLIAPSVRCRAWARSCMASRCRRTAVIRCSPTCTRSMRPSRTT